MTFLLCVSECSGIVSEDMGTRCNWNGSKEPSCKTVLAVLHLSGRYMLEQFNYN